jgi:hypothetical protein
MGWVSVTAGNEHRWICVSPGSVKKSNYISFGAFEDDLDRLRKCPSRS